PKALRPLGLALAHRGDFAGALPHLERAETDAEVVAALLRSAVALGRLADAEKHAARAAAVEGPAPELKRSVEFVRALESRRDELLRVTPPPAGRPEAWRAAVDKYVCAEGLHARRELPERVAALT